MIPFQNMKRSVQRVLDFLRPMQIPLHSAYTSFYLILSLFPFMMLFLGTLRYSSLQLREVFQILQEVLPANLMPVATSLMESSYHHSSGTVVGVSALAVLFSASRGMFGVRNGLSAVYSRGDEQSYLRRRGFSVLYTASFLLLLWLTLMVYLFGTTLLDYLQMTTTPVLLLLMNLIDLRWALLLFLQIALFTLMYAYLPHQHNRIRDSWPGAVTASLGWLLYSKLFSVYVAYVTGYATIYGSVYALALGMLWLYFCISIFFYGAAVNCYLQRRKFHKGG